MDIETTLRSVAAAVQLQLDELYRRPGEPVPGSALDQEGLRNGAEIVNEYIQFGELELAFEHFLYMANEPDIPLSVAQFDAVETVGRRLSVAETKWKCLTIRSEP